LNNSEAVALLTESLYWPRVAEIRSELKVLRSVIITDNEIEGCHSWQAALRDEPSDPVDVDIAPEMTLS